MITIAKWFIELTAVILIALTSCLTIKCFLYVAVFAIADKPTSWVSLVLFMKFLEYFDRIIVLTGTRGIVG